MTKLFRVFIIGLMSILVFSCGLSDEEVKERLKKALEAKKWKASKQLFDEYIKRTPEDTEAYFSRARIATNVDPLDLEGIIADLNTYLEKKPESSVAKMFRFQAYLHIAEFEKALEDIETIIKKHGKNSFLLSWKGNAAFLAKKFDIAAKVYEQRTRMSGTYDDVRNNYYYMVFSKHFGGNKEGAIWDTAFLEDRGFKQDSLLMKALINDEIKYDEIANFELPKFTIIELENMLKNNCHEFDLFPDKTYRSVEILNDIAREPNVRDLEALLPKKEEVYVLNLSNNNYEELPKTLFAFKNLQILNLSFNQFTNLEKTIEELSQLPNLKVLLLNRCGIKELPGNIKLLDQLLMLDMYGNRFEKLPEAIGELRNLKYLGLENNLKLTSLPKSIGNLQCLQVLDISQTKLTSLPVEVAYCSQLIMLSANRSRINTLPENFGDLINLRNLSLYGNKIEKLPQSFGDLEVLKYLNVSANRLKDLPGSFKKLDSLGRVSLDGNDFTVFPTELESLKSVFSIIVHDTPIKNIPYAMAKKPSLERILVNPKYITQKNIDSLKAINPTLYVIPQN
ncbi:hypothetical protein [Kordia sp.]|uniref:leucine-rich repeat domain-containing protein n=1 Tax=Kordia sp. TaxID=1965332 RepID=UPI0025B921FC|nr:hypothetical protein [Kordia sp.]MCH2192892.1 hypothetical protein [Kordia sp.]